MFGHPAGCCPALSSRCTPFLRGRGHAFAAGEVINIQNHSQMAQLLGMDPQETASAQQRPRPRAAMVILARDQDLEGVLLSMGRLEARFNNSQYRCAAQPLSAPRTAPVQPQKEGTGSACRNYRLWFQRASFLAAADY